MCSPTRTAGSDVAMVANSPRISAGASGLGSQVSRWLIPPSSNTRMTPLAPGRAGGEAATARGDERGSTNALKPKRNACRRVIPTAAEGQVGNMAVKLLAGFQEGPDPSSRRGGRRTGHDLKMVKYGDGTVKPPALFVNRTGCGQVFWQRQPVGLRQTCQVSRVLGDHPRANPHTPALSPMGRGRPRVGCAAASAPRRGVHRPLLPAGEKVPAGRMRGHPPGPRPLPRPDTVPSLILRSEVHPEN